MAINIFTYDSGGHLPIVETHIMEHGLMYLQGQGVYMLGTDWYPIKKGDVVLLPAEIGVIRCIPDGKINLLEIAIPEINN